MPLASPTEADVAWTEERTIALMHEGVPFVDAVERAARECTERVLERRRAQDEALERAVAQERARRSAARILARDAEIAHWRAAAERKATPGNAPTLTTSIGAALRAKRR